MNEKNKDKECENEVRNEVSTFMALLKIQKDTLISQGEILISLESIDEKLDNNNTNTKERIILVMAVCALAGVQVGSTTGLFEWLSSLF